VLSLSTLLLAVAAAWAVAALAVQAIGARAAFRAPHAPPAGRASDGVLYGFTGAMMPARKESVSRHPVSFAAGLLLHLGVAASFVTVLVSIFPFPPALQLGRFALAPAAGAGLFAGTFLLIRRLATPDLREISPPDDFVAIVAITLFLTGSLAFWSGILPAAALRILATILLVYLPLGKLRHIVFFYLARADLSARLGFRGVYPPRGGGDGGRS
jgi:hypothetical protein